MYISPKIIKEIVEKIVIPSTKDFVDGEDKFNKIAVLTSEAGVILLEFLNVKGLYTMIIDVEQALEVIILITIEGFSIPVTLAVTRFSVSEKSVGNRSALH